MSLKQELQTERVGHLDLSSFATISTGASVREAVAEMRSAKTNACLIMDNERLIGVFTDRDVLRKVANVPDRLDQPIDDMMTPAPTTVFPDHSASDALWLMDDKHFRNLPVINKDGRVIGNMTHRAVIKFLAARYPVEILNQPPRPDHFPSQAEGG